MKGNIISILSFSIYHHRRLKSSFVSKKNKNNKFRTDCSKRTEQPKRTEAIKRHVIHVILRNGTIPILFVPTTLLIGPFPHKLVKYTILARKMATKTCTTQNDHLRNVVSILKKQDLDIPSVLYTNRKNFRHSKYS